MSKRFEIQAKFGKTWIIIDSEERLTDALHYVREKSGESYPMRIVRVEKTIVFGEGK